MTFSLKDMYTFMPCHMKIDGEKIKYVNNVVLAVIYVMILILQDKRDIYIVQPISSKLVFLMFN